MQDGRNGINNFVLAALGVSYNKREEIIPAWELECPEKGA
jgi:hypothetical protein